MRNAKLKLGILASGSGTNLQAIIDASEAGHIGASVEVVISDVASAKALERAKEHKIPSVHVDRKNFKDKRSFEDEIVKCLGAHGAELVCLAGYMRIVGPTILDAYPDMVINIHPALLPSFPGLDAQGQAFDYGVKVSGCTVHFVDDEVDHGPIILQAVVPVEEGDTRDTLQGRILKEEHRIYPEAIRLIAEKKLKIVGRKVYIGS